MVIKVYKYFDGEQELIVNVDHYGSIEYYNSKNQIHRKDGPARICKNNNYEAWLNNGIFHRENGPARDWFNGRKEFWYNGRYLGKTEKELKKYLTEILLK